ncbi:TlpA family protein disulfide reductase [Nocardioides sp. LHG3406-4]|uniref:TlpA family protein disulfide reductase n=1 Tax=Nocardioides sp. LHG3406-4 TaxID=2804575 RepID=UPI003CE6E5CF
MRRIAAALAVVVLLLAGCDDAPARKPLPQPLPTLQLDAFDADSEPLALADVRGPTVINFWASWCTPCRAELPVLEQFHQQYAGRVDMLGIDFQDGQPDKAAQLIERSGVTYPLYEDFDGDLSGLAPLPKLTRLPFLVLVDDQGEVVHQEFVEIKTVAQLEALVGKHLGVDG